MKAVGTDRPADGTGSGVSGLALGIAKSPVLLLTGVAGIQCAAGAAPIGIFAIEVNEALVTGGAIITVAGIAVCPANRTNPGVSAPAGRIAEGTILFLARSAAHGRAAPAPVGIFGIDDDILAADYAVVRVAVGAFGVANRTGPNVSRLARGIRESRTRESIRVLHFVIRATFEVIGPRR